MLSATTRVHPVAPHGSPPSHAVAGHYTIEASHELPRVDTTRTVKSVWLSSRGLRRYNALIHRSRGIITPINTAAVLFLGTVAFFPAQPGRWLAWPMAPLILLPLTTTFLGMRHDMIQLLLGTYDFWYQGLTYAACSTLFAIHTADSRSVFVTAGMPMLAVVLLADANSRGARRFFAFSVAATVLSLGNALVWTLDWVDGARPLALVRVFDHALTTDALVAHGFVVITVVHAHNAYARRQFAGKRGSSARSGSRLTTTVRCVLYRCRLRWCDRNTGSRLSVQRRPAKSSFDETFVQLRFRGLHQVVDAHRTLLGWSPHTHRGSWWPSLLRVGLALSSLVGLSATHVTFVCVALGRSPKDDALVRALAVTSLAATACVWLFFLGCVHQRDMLRQLHASFDFVFIAVHLVLASLCLCDLCGWDARALAALAGLLWLHWALTIDAIAPLTRESLALPVRKFAVLVELAFLASLVLFALDMLHLKTQRFQDHEILARLGLRRHTDVANWSVAAFFLNRLLTLVAWLGRSLWRLATYQPDELVVLRGTVEYDDYAMHRRERRSVASATQLQQITLALSQRSQCNDADRSQLSEPSGT